MGVVWDAKGFACSVSALHVAERAVFGIPPLPINFQQATDLVELLKNSPRGEDDYLRNLITYSVPVGVDEAGKVKAGSVRARILAASVAKGEQACPLMSRVMGGFPILILPMIM